MPIPTLVDGLITDVIYSDDRWPGRNRPIWFVVHTPEFPEIPRAARAVAEYLATSPRTASVHFCGDNVEVIRTADDTDGVAGAAGANSLGLHYELAGYAGQTAAEWMDAYSRGAMHMAARTFALAHEAWDIPAIHVPDDGVRELQPGIITHDQCSRIFGGTHWDPGPNFPMDHFVGLCRAETRSTDIMHFSHWNRQYNQASPTEYDPIVEFAQRGLRALGYYGPQYRIDGKRGPITNQAWRNFEKDIDAKPGPNRTAGPFAWRKFIRRLGLD